MNSQPRVVDTGAIPPNTIKPLPAGATNIYTAGIIKQTNQNIAQNNLVGTKSGGKRKRKSNQKYNYVGGIPPVSVVPSAPSYAVNKAEINANNTAIGGLALKVDNQAVFDKTVGEGPNTTAMLAAKQSATYYGNGMKGGKKKGGGAWGCLSGGKKSRKNCRTKRRNTRKQMKRYRR
jgi:hypothetical protein